MPSYIGKQVEIVKPRYSSFIYKSLAAGLEITKPIGSLFPPDYKYFIPLEVLEILILHLMGKNWHYGIWWIDDLIATTNPKSMAELRK